MNNQTINVDDSPSTDLIKMVNDNFEQIKVAASKTKTRSKYFNLYLEKASMLSMYFYGGKISTLEALNQLERLRIEALKLVSFNEWLLLSKEECPKIPSRFIRRVDSFLDDVQETIDPVSLLLVDNIIK